MRKSPTHGFTLIELLVVVAIVSLLAAILFPVFNRARENGRRASCQSNLKQVGLGLMQYTRDYDERTPVQLQGDVHYAGEPVDFSNSSVPATSWGRSIGQYLKNYQLFVCPSSLLHPTSPPIGESQNSYYFNGVLVGRSLAAITESSRMIVMEEAQTKACIAYMRPIDTSPDGVENYIGWLSLIYANLHFDGSNYLYMDGHVKFRNAASVCAREYGLNSPLCGQQSSYVGNGVSRDASWVG